MTIPLWIRQGKNLPIPLNVLMIIELSLRSRGRTLSASDIGTEIDAKTAKGL